MTPEDRLGHRQRLREKFEKHEQDAFLDYELLELILTYSIPRRDVKPIAKELLTYMGETITVNSKYEEGSTFTFTLTKAEVPDVWD